MELTVLLLLGWQNVSIIICFIHILFIRTILNIQLNRLFIVVLSLHHERCQQLTDSVAVRGGVLRQQGERRRPKRSEAGGAVAVRRPKGMQRSGRGEGGNDLVSSRRGDRTSTTTGEGIVQGRHPHGGWRGVGEVWASENVLCTISRTLAYRP